MKWQIRYSYAERPMVSLRYGDYRTRRDARVALARVALSYAGQYGASRVRTEGPDDITIAGRTAFGVFKRA